MTPLKGLVKQQVQMRESHAALSEKYVLQGLAWWSSG